MPEVPTTARTPAQRRAEAEARARRRAGEPAGAPAARPAPSAVRRRRAVAVLLLSGVVATGVWFAGLGSPERTRAGAQEPAAAALPQLPGGGRRLFPDRRVVAFAGNPNDRRLGALGVGSVPKMLSRLRRQARPYGRSSRPVLPALELITSVATAEPGTAGDHVTRLPASTIDRYLRLARQQGVLLLLDIQPGAVNFPSEMSRLTRWLREPDVGLALDPEWRVEPGQIPGQVIGSVDAEEVNAASAQLAAIVKAGRLPQKLFVVHQFTDGMIRNPERLVNRPGLATVINIDGFGSKADKVGKYRALAASKPRFRHGFKLFYHEDPSLMQVKSVMALQPRPDLVVYE